MQYARRTKVLYMVMEGIWGLFLLLYGGFVSQQGIGAFSADEGLFFE